MNLKRLIFYFFGLISGLQAQTPRSLQACEQAFKQGNLLLLAERYEADIARAGVMQAKIWEQPYFSAAFNLVNPQDGRAFDIGARGQKELAVEQLIYLGRKKRNEVAFARTQVELAEVRLEQLERDLLYVLRQSYYTVYFERQKIGVLDAVIRQIDTLTLAYGEQAAKGNVPLKELVRLQTLLLDLRNTRLALQKNILQEQEIIKTVTGLPDRTEPVLEASDLARFYDRGALPGIDSLLQAVLDKHPDYKLMRSAIKSQETLVRWQKSLSVPDLTVGLAYDQRGGAFQNQVNFTFGIPLPFWNKNKGNLQMAQAELHQRETQLQYVELDLRHRLERAYDTWQQYRAQYVQLAAQDQSALQAVYKGILTNFQKRNITLLEFTDFMESYNETMLQINELQKELVLACEQINYIVHENIFE